MENVRGDGEEFLLEAVDFFGLPRFLVGVVSPNWSCTKRPCTSMPFLHHGGSPWVRMKRSRQQKKTNQNRKRTGNENGTFRYQGEWQCHANHCLFAFVGSK
jgi:hypothetical protein